MLKEEKKQKERLVLLDAHAILHRAYHALPDFATSKGEPTGALYGLVNMIFKIITDLKPDYLIACYDLPKETFRHQVYDQYKAGRIKADNDLVIQMQSSRNLCETLGIKIYDKEGFDGAKGSRFQSHDPCKSHQTGRPLRRFRNSCKL